MLNKMARWAYDQCSLIVAPPVCAYCKRLLAERQILCGTCVSAITPIVSTTLEITKKYPMTVFAITQYKDPIKSLILAKRSRAIIASYQLGELMWQCTPLRYTPIDYIIPVPLHWTRFVYRGYNQAEESARIIATHAHRPVVQLLKRVKWTSYQSSVNVTEREPNIDGAFALATHDKALYRDKHLLLVDDLMTTGVTLHKAARELVALRPASITAVVAARVV
ncbi:MAG: ComF family protein [Candidatus Babeliales bacterium]